MTRTNAFGQNWAMPSARVRTIPALILKRSSLAKASQVFPTAPTFQGVQQTYAPPTELVNLGLASRESRLDERWATFMHESGYLDELNFRP